MTTWMHVAGWVLVHFLWQGAALAIVAALALHALRRHSASVRYGFACATLVAMLAAVGATAALVDVSGVPKAQPQRVHVLIARQRPGDAALPIPLDTRPPSKPRTFNRADVEALFPWVVSMWLTGVALLLARGAAGWLRVRRLHQQALRSACSSWQAAGARVATRLGLARVVRIVELPHSRCAFRGRVPAPDRRAADLGHVAAQCGAGGGDSRARAGARPAPRLCS